MAFDIEGARKAGYQDAEIADHLAKEQKFDVAAARQAGYGDSDIIAHLSQAQQAKIGQFERQPDSFAKRLALGVAEPYVGTAQLVAHGTQSTPFMEQQDRQAQALVEAQKEGAPEGIDWGRISGNVIGLLPTLALTRGNPATVGGMAKGGAILGGASALTAPVDTREGGYAGAKATQGVVGTVAGALGGPIIGKAIQGAGYLGAQIVNKLRSLAPSSQNPAQIQVMIQQTLQQNGVDPASVPPAFYDEIVGQVQRALGAPIDEASLANRAAFEAVGAQGTRGQITQDPAQYGMEAYVRQAPGGEALASQYKSTLETLNQQLGNLAGGAAPPMRTAQAGQMVQGALQQADERGANVVNRLYEQVRRNPDADLPIDYQAVQQATVQELYDRSLLGALPSTLRGPLERGFQGQGAAQVGRSPTIRTADDINKTISTLIAQARGKNPPDNAALEAIAVYKRNLDEAVADAASGTAVAQDLFTARAAAADRFAIHEAIPALRAAVDGTVAPDDFMRRFVYNANEQDFSRLAGFIRSASPQSWQQIRGQVLSDIQRSASPTGQAQDFSAAQFNKAIRSLDKSGRLEVLFNPQEVAILRNIGRVGTLVTKGPPGVSQTGLSGAAKASAMLVNMIGKLPVFGRLGGVVQAAGQKGGNVVTANRAMASTPVVQPELQTIIPNPLAGIIGQGTGLLSYPLASE